ncbi:D-alanyl-D-alanine carboxypeptidase [Bacillus timonensis]|nr:D-alanyl-D-alanine carboxypeptidase [Bacillus timonensis]
MRQLRIYCTCVLIIIIGLQIPLTGYTQEEKSVPNLQSEAAILLDATTGAILYEKGIQQEMNPASLTKVATAIYAIEKGNLNDIVTVSKRARQIDGTRVYLEEGEKVPLKKLIQGLLINSGNDAGVAIAEHLDGSVEVFAENMNQFLRKKVKVKQTTFKNPHGLFDENHKTTAYDLAIITKYALKNSTFTEIFATAELKWTGESWDTTLFNHHRMFREIPYEGFIGGKTGYVNESGQTLITVAKRNNMKLIAVVLKAKTKRQIYRDTANLLDYGFFAYTYGLIPTNQAFQDEEKNRYVTNEDIYYPHLIGENPVLSVQDGSLVITGEDKRIIFKKQLAEDPLNKVMENSKIVTFNSSSKESKSNTLNVDEEDRNTLSVMIIILISISIPMWVILFRKKRDTFEQ